MRPHTVMIVFEDVATSTGNMGFTIKLNRNFEGIPTGAGKFLERGTAKLTKYSLPLEILRDMHNQEDIMTEILKLRRRLEPE